MSDAEQFLEENRGLVVNLVNRYSVPTSKFDREDIEQEANLAVVRALEMYDEEKHSSKPTTYAYSAINRSCRDFVRANINDLRVAHGRQAKEWKERQEAEEEEKPKNYGSFGSTESPIAVRLDKQVQADDGQAASVGDMIPASGDASLLESCVKKEQIDILFEEINALPEREREIFTAHYLDGEKYSTIAKRKGLTRQRIHQISKSAMTKVSGNVKERLEFELFV